MKSVIHHICKAFAVIFTVSCLPPAASAGHTQYPLTLQNCGRSITFPRKPQSVVAIGQNSAEILYMLGLAHHVKATALWFTPVLPEFAAVDAGIKRLSPNNPSFESVVEQKPDMVASQLEWVIGPMGATATYEQFDTFAIPVYTSPADCNGKDNNAGNDGLRREPFSMAMIYQEIAELAQIFDVNERGEKVVAALKAREQATREKTAALRKAAAGKTLRAVFWYSSPDMEMDPYVAGRSGGPGYISRILGISNIIQSDYEWPTVGWETIVKANPDIIVLAEMSRRRFPADDARIKRSFLASDPVTRLLPAVRKGRIILLDAQAMNGSVRTIDGIERLAEAIGNFGLER